MKKTAVLCALVALLASACASTVTTYDSRGKVIGTCKAQAGFVVGGGAHCTGSANQEGAMP